jgi:biotin operon repressor
MSSFERTWKSINLPDNPPSTERVRRNLAKEVYDTILKEERAIVRSPTAAGKSHLIASTFEEKHKKEYSAEEHGSILHLSVTKDARDEAMETSEEYGVNAIKLEGREDACPVARGEHDSMDAPHGMTPSEWLDYVCDEGGVSFSDAHSRLDEYVDGGLPCNHGDSNCDSVTQYERLSEDPEVIHATHNFAYVKDLIRERNVVIDERPSFVDIYKDEDRNAFKQSITDYLVEEIGMGHQWEDLMHYFQNEEEDKLKEIQQRVKQYLNEHAHEDEELTREYLYRFSPEVVLAIISADKIIPEREKLGNSSFFLGEYDGWKVVFDGNNNVKAVHKPPDLSEARSVVCLDAHPSPDLWRVNTGIENMEVKRTLSDKQRREWRVAERNLYVVKIGSPKHYFTNGWGGSEMKAKSLIKRLRDKYGKDFRSCISPEAVESYNNEGEDEDGVREHMLDSGIKEDRLKTIHYGEQMSNNEFEGENVGLVVGCNDLGDDGVLTKLALLGKKATPKKDPDSGGGDNNRKSGRTFTGPHSELADQITESVRGENVAQSIGRFSRKPGEESSKAIVYVWTSAVWDSLVDYNIDDFPNEFHDGGKSHSWRTFEYIRESEEFLTHTELSEELNCTRENVRGNVVELRDKGILEYSEGTGYQGADEYRLSEPHVDPRV